MNFYFNQFNYGFNGIFRRNNSTNAMVNSFKKNTNQKLIDSINEKLEKYNKNANKVDSVALRSVSEELAKSGKTEKAYGVATKYGTNSGDEISDKIENILSENGIDISKGYTYEIKALLESPDSELYKQIDSAFSESGIELQEGGKNQAIKAALESIQNELQQQIDEMSSKGDSPAVKWFKEKAAAWEMVREQMEQYKNRDVMLETINNKLAAGAKLTKEEMDHLKVKDPQKYQRLKASEAEQKAYENEMKAAKTKDEVDRLKMNRIGQALSSVKSIMSNPNIPEGPKLGLVSEIGQKVSRINEITAKYKRSTEYGNLPTDEEKRIAEKEINEAKEAQLRGENTPEEVRPEEGTAVEDAEEKPEIKPEASNNVNNSSVENSKEAVEKPVVLQEKETHNIKPGVRIDMDGNSNIKTKAEAETSREALKVKRSEAQAGYRKIKSLSNSAEASNFTAIG